jgi:hypothetical protein
VDDRCQLCDAALLRNWAVLEAQQRAIADALRSHLAEIDLRGLDAGMAPPVPGMEVLQAWSCADPECDGHFSVRMTLDRTTLEQLRYLEALVAEQRTGPALVEVLGRALVVVLGRLEQSSFIAPRAS